MQERKLFCCCFYSEEIIFLIPNFASYYFIQFFEFFRQKEDKFRWLPVTLFLKINANEKSDKDIIPH